MEAHEYSNGDITILWKPGHCTHSGICVRTLPQVYNPSARPWLKPDKATTAQLKEQVAMCPSGALSIKEQRHGNNEVSGSGQSKES